MARVVFTGEASSIGFDMGFDVGGIILNMLRDSTSTERSLTKVLYPNQLYVLEALGSFAGYNTNGDPTGGTINAFSLTRLAQPPFWPASKLDVSGLTFDVQTIFNLAQQFPPGAPQQLNALIFGGDDTFIGSDAKETINAYGGNDFVSANSGSDIIFGGGGNDTIDAGDGEDRLEGGDGNDSLTGGNGNDECLGGSGLDVIDGGNGNDTFSAINAGDTLIGGAGSDRVYLYFDEPTVGVSLASSSILSATASTLSDGTVLQGFEGFILGFGSGADTFTFDSTLPTAFSEIDAGSGLDKFVIDLRNNVTASIQFVGNEGYRFQVLGASTYTLVRNFDRYEMFLGSGNDSIDGGNNNDLLNGGAGNDTLIGRGGDDTLEGGLGVDVLGGGAGFDFASYANATTGLTLFMGGGTFNSGEADGDVHTSIEGLIGSNFSDIIGGDAGVNELRGLNGNDFIYGRGGADTLLGGDGNDVLSGGLDGDRLEGGAGIDVAFYREAATGFTANMQTGVGTGEAAGDTYFDVENIWGSDFDDVLTGNNGAGQVYGFAGNDNLSGLDGDDFFYGGVGNDTMTGGAGIDSYFFLSWNDKLNQFGTPEPYEGGDVWTDFTSGTDRIILSRFWFGFGNIGGPAAALTETHANFVTNGVVGTNRPSLIWNAGNRTLSFDADGNGATQAVLLGTLQTGATLALSDIWTA